MRLTPGTRLGAYSIQTAIGAGGMGEVYQARDTNLARDVAIKVLPEAFAHDSERLARFEREARTLAALNHPNIAIVHGLESVSSTDSGHVRALVMELVDGPTLAELIGGLTVPDALRIARQIAEGLEAAHEQGIVHRDLKPANVKVRADGTVKVLDFGLAKMLDGPPEGGHYDSRPLSGNRASGVCRRRNGVRSAFRTEYARGPRDASGGHCRRTTSARRDQRCCTIRGVRDRNDGLCVRPAASLSTARGLVLTDGRRDPVSLKLPTGIYAHPRVSPDGRMLAVSQSEGSTSDIWTYDLSGEGVAQRLTLGGESRFPVWSADSRRVTFQSARDRAIWWQSIDAGAAERLTSPLDGEEHISEAWSPDGLRLLFSIRRSFRYALTVLTLKDLKTEPFGDVQSADPTSASFSPDGRWIAYAWTLSGGGSVSPNRGVFVEPFPPTGVKRQAPKTLLDYHPRWSRDGKSIAYVPGAARPLVSVAVSPGPPFVFGTTVEMPRSPIPGMLSTEFRGYDLLPDGRIVSLSSPLDDALASGSASEVRVVLNWSEGLKRLVPAK